MSLNYVYLLIYVFLLLFILSVLQCFIFAAMSYSGLAKMERTTGEGLLKEYVTAYHP